MFTFESLGPVAQLGQVGPAGAHVQACDQDTRDRDRPRRAQAASCHASRLAGREDLGRDREHGREERLGPDDRGRDGVQGDRQRDREQRAPDRPLRQHRRHQHDDAEHRAGPDPAQRQHQGSQNRDDQADRQRRMRGVRRLGEGKRPEGGQGGEQGTPDVEDPGRGGRVPGFSTGVQKDILLSEAFRCNTTHAAARIGSTRAALSHANGRSNPHQKGALSSIPRGTTTNPDGRSQMSRRPPASWTRQAARKASSSGTVVAKHPGSAQKGHCRTWDSRRCRGCRALGRRSRSRES